MTKIEACCCSSLFLHLSHPLNCKSPWKMSKLFLRWHTETKNTKRWAGVLSLSCFSISTYQTQCHASGRYFPVWRTSFIALWQQTWIQLLIVFLWPICRRAAPSAEFSVDRHRHLMSFLTMLGPSPDWNVGLSAEDLCTKDCGWVQRVVQDLIPWDAGTDSGVTYEVCGLFVIFSKSKVYFKAVKNDSYLIPGAAINAYYITLVKILLIMN